MASQPPNTQIHRLAPSLPLHFDRGRRRTATLAHKDYNTSIQIMSSHAQTCSGPSSNVVMSLPPDPKPIFELNQARRAKVTRELEALRSCESFVTLNVRSRIRPRCTHTFIIVVIINISSESDTIPPFLQHSSSGQPWRDWKHSSRRRSSTAKCWKI